MPQRLGGAGTTVDSGLGAADDMVCRGVRLGRDVLGRDVRFRGRFQVLGEVVVSRLENIVVTIGIIWASLFKPLVFSWLRRTSTEAMIDGIFKPATAQNPTESSRFAGRGTSHKLMGWGGDIVSGTQLWRNRGGASANDGQGERESDAKPHLGSRPGGKEVCETSFKTSERATR